VLVTLCSLFGVRLIQFYHMYRYWFIGKYSNYVARLSVAGDQPYVKLIKGNEY
jgi:hypothetical protein